MPRKDGTGPEGKGPKTGRGLGPCGTGDRRGRRDDFRFGRGRRNFAQDEMMEPGKKGEAEENKDAEN